MELSRRLEWAWAELQPTHDRAAGTLRITVAALLVTVVMLSFRMPFPDIGPYLVILMSQRDMFLTRAAAALGVFATAVACVLIYSVAAVAWDVAWLRVTCWIVLFGGGFLLMHVLAEPRIALGPLVILSLFTFAFDQHPFPNRVLGELGWLWAILGLTLAATFLTQWLFQAPTAVEYLRGQFRRALIAAEKGCLARAHGRPPESMDPEELESMRDRIEKLEQVGVLSAGQSGNCRRYLSAVELAARAMEGGDGADHALAPAWIALAVRIRGCRRRIIRGEVTGAGAVWPARSTAAIRTAEAAFAAAIGPPSSAVRAPHPLLASDWNTNPAHLEFALRATGATIACYLFMSLTAWDGIHTCMITCVVCALANVPAQIRKQNNRVIGAVIGGILGVFTVVFLVPQAEGLTGLLTILAAGTALSAWVSLGSERTLYVGWQMALAFYMTVLQGPHPTTKLDVLSDRLAGILVGVLAMRAAFVWFAPGAIPAAGMERSETG